MVSLLFATNFTKERSHLLSQMLYFLNRMLALSSRRSRLMQNPQPGRQKKSMWSWLVTVVLLADPATLPIMQYFSSGRQQ
jgi:hypothetical protein